MITNPFTFHFFTNTKRGGKFVTRVRRLKKLLLQTEQEYKNATEPNDVFELSEKIKKLKIDLNESIQDYERKRFERETKDIQIVQRETPVQKSKWKSIFTWTGISILTVAVAVGSYIAYDMLHKSDDGETSENGEV